MSADDLAKQQKQEDQSRFTAAVFEAVNRYGVWMALHWFTVAMRGPCEAEEGKNRPAKQPRRERK